MNQPAPPAPSAPGKASLGRCDNFAELMRECEAHLSKEHIVPVTMLGTDNLRDLVTAVREQQAAIDGIMDGNTDALKQARAVLAKWRIE